MLKLRIKALRKGLGLTLEDLSERAGVSKSLLSEIENHKSTVNTIRLESFAAALGVHPRELLDDDEDGAATTPRSSAQESDPTRRMWVTRVGAGATYDAQGLPALALSLEDDAGVETICLMPEGVARIGYDRQGRVLERLAESEGQQTDEASA